MTTIDELERRVGFLESEVEGEKAVTRHVLEQAIRNGDVLNALRVDLTTQSLRLDHVGSEVILANAALRTHGNLLNILRQDVIALRQDVTVLRQDVDARFGAMERNMEARFGAVMEAIRALSPHGPPA